MKRIGGDFVELLDEHNRTLGWWPTMVEFNCRVSHT